MKNLKILSSGNNNILNNDIMKINWLITTVCNYRCSYCTVRDPNASFVDFDNLKIAVSKIAALKNKKITITLTGGEPTIHPEFRNFLEYLFNKKTDRLHITTITNLSRSLKFYHELINSNTIPKKNLSFVSSYHLEYAHPGKFVEKATLLADSGFKVHIWLMAHPDHMQDIKALHKVLNSHTSDNLKIGIKLIRENFGPEADKRYTKEDLDWLNNFYHEEKSKGITIELLDTESQLIKNLQLEPNEVVSRGLNKYKGMICHAGANMMAINKEGDIAPAVNCKGVYKNKYNIYDPSISIQELNQPIICPFNACGCLANIPLPKYTKDYFEIKERLEPSQISSI